MREIDAIPVPIDDSCADRLLQRRSDVPAVGALEQRERGFGQRGRSQQHPARTRREASEPRSQQLVEALRNRKRVVKRGLSTTGRELAAEFECVERVTARDLVQPAERLVRVGRAQPLAQHALERSQAERTNRDSEQAGRLELPLEPKRQRLPGFDYSLREQQRNGLIAEPADGELQSGRRRSVQPLHIVNRQQHGRITREHP